MVRGQTHGVTIPHDFGWVVMAVGSSQFMNIFLSVQVSMARKKYDVQYPTMYADASKKDADKFNCVQRAHQNTLETWAPVTILALVNGLVYPKASAALFGVWQLGRVIYGIGYAKGGPKGRMAGGILSHLGDLPLMIMTFFTGAKLAKLTR
mmetsp:Transcript_989/g.1531  ORF Transcript_989/g.1531 Transcript_989/m.1531 type:complete len:151 (-) Transcript_989:74-526(-)